MLNQDALKSKRASNNIIYMISGEWHENKIQSLIQHNLRVSYDNVVIGAEERCLRGIHASYLFVFWVNKSKAET